MKKLYLIRHGECEGPGTYVGRGSDVPLTGEGRSDIAALGELLRRREIKPSRIITSSLVRARETGKILAEKLAVPHTPRQCPPDARLDETHFGLFEGLTYDGILRDYPFKGNLWFKDPWKNAPPGGESTADTLRRVSDFHHDLITAEKDRKGDTLIVAHGGSLRLLICLLLDIPAEGQWHFSIRRGGMAQFELDGDFAVLKELYRP